MKSWCHGAYLAVCTRLFIVEVVAWCKFVAVSGMSCEGATCNTLALFARTCLCIFSLYHTRL